MSAATTLPEPEEDPAAALPATPFEFDEPMQAKLVNMLMRDHQFNTRSAGLIQPEYFTDEANQALVRLANEHFKLYREPIGFGNTFIHVFKKALADKRLSPDIGTEIKRRMLAGAFKIPVADREFLLTESIKFAKNRATENALLNSMEALQKGDFAKIEKLMGEALKVGDAGNSISYDYFAEIENRTQRRKDFLSGVITRSGITTGCADFDKYLYHHGWGRKELSVMIAGAKVGKTMSLVDFAKAASLAKFNVYYASCEVSSEILSDRVDANIADIIVNEVGTHPHKVEAAIKAAHANAGRFIMEDFASGTLKASQLRRRLDHWRGNGVLFDMIVVDYGDLMAPEHRSDSPRENLRQIFVDLRAIAFEENAAVLTATQSNREGAKGALVKATDVSEDFSKVMTADIVLTINADADERLRDECRIFFAAARNVEDGFILRIKSVRNRMQFLKSVIGKEYL